MTCKKRWRMALNAIIYFIKALFVMSKSNSTIDVQPENEHEHEHEHSLEDKPPRFQMVDVTKLVSDMVREKRMECLTQFGGVKKVAALLQTHLKHGIIGNYGINMVERPPAKGFVPFLLEAFNDTRVLLNLIMAVPSIGFGIKQYGWKDGWYDGGSNILAVVLGVVIAAVFNFKQYTQFEELLSKSSDTRVEVVRGGRRQTISIYDVVVGDIACLKIGDQIPADGLFLKGHSLTVDESSVTGESDHVHVDGDRNPFLLSGTKVIDGFANMLVTSVGMNTAWGETMRSGARDSVVLLTPLQARLNKLTSDLGKVGLLGAVVVLLVSLIRYFTGSTGEFNRSETKFDDVMNAIIRIVGASITIVEVAIPEGLPLAVTLTLAYSMKKMMRDNGMIRELFACERIGSVTTICTDKTGILTLNQMEVAEVWLGEQTITEYRHLAPNLLKLLKEGIGLNTSGSIYQPLPTSLPEISGSPTERALLSWAVLDLGMNIDELKQQYEIIYMESFNSKKKRSGILTRENRGNRIHTHWKGAADVILAMCSNYYDQTGKTMIIDAEKRVQTENIIRGIASKSLRCIAFAQKGSTEDDGQAYEKPEVTGLVLLAILGLEKPCRPGVEAAVEDCKNAGVKIKMITGDNVLTAKATASKCGILAPDEDLDEEAVIEGRQFRNYSDEERMDKIDKIQVMARSSPDDKLLMVRCLKQKGHVVAVTGDGTNDAPALKEADVGLSMGIQGTEVAKQSSDIVILDDNFISVVTLLWRGRCVCTNIQKFIQFQLTLNIAAVVINFVAAVSSGKVPLTNLQLLWVNLVMVALGALVLATEQPTFDLREMPLAGRFEPLITKVMWGNIIAQALYQVTVVLILLFKGRSMFHVNEEVKDTLIFNVVVFCQVFNVCDARKLEKKNIIEGLGNNRLFILIVGLTLAVQLVMVEFLNKFANTGRLTWEQWGICIGIAALSWPIALLFKCILVVVLGET